MRSGCLSKGDSHARDLHLALFQLAATPSLHSCDSLLPEDEIATWHSCALALVSFWQLLVQDCPWFAASPKFLLSNLLRKAPAVLLST